MINAEKLKPILDGYKETFSEHWPEENFKWKAVKYFQDHWDINAPNFGKMFDEATSKTRPMLEDQNVRARKQIISFAKMNDSATRQMFRDLLDEDKSLTERVEKFKNKSIVMQEKCDDITLNRSYQDLNAISTYLWLCYPDKYYIYKYTYIKDAAEELGLANPIANGDVKNILESFELYDDICEIIQKDDEICNLISESLTKDCWPDKKLHITAIDILVYNSKYYKDRKIKKNNVKEEQIYPLNAQPQEAINNDMNEYHRAAKWLKEYAVQANINIPNADGEIKSALKYFQKTYSPEALEKLDDSNLLTSMFFTVDDNPNSLCRWLEMNKECKTYFGSISGGSSYKYGLFQKKETGVWTTGTGKKPQELSEEEALKLGKKIRDALVNGVKIIRESVLDTIDAYEKLDKDLERTIGKQYYNWQWIHKYFSIICNNKLSCFHSTDWQEHVLRALGIRPSNRYYARSGQISMIQNYAGWCYFQLFTVFDKRFGEPRAFYRISSTEGGYDYSKIWAEEGVVGIGQPGLGDLKGYIVNKSIDTEMLRNKLVELYYPNDKDNAKDGARDIKRFYECGNNTVFVVMNGDQLIALADHVGENYFDADAEIGNLRPVKWKFVFSAEDELPDSTKGKSTTCFRFGDEKNLRFLYNKYYYVKASILSDISNYNGNKNVDKLNDQSLSEMEITEDAIKQRKLFEDWMGLQIKENGEPYSKDYTIPSYINLMERGYREFKPYKNYSSVFQIRNVQELDEYIDYLFKAPGFDEFNIKTGHYTCSSGIKKYRQFLEEQASQPINYHTGYESKYTRNRIVFGAPGTGKSYLINQDRLDLLGNNAEDDYERVTFHPDYSYANFVGTYKPVPCKKDGNDTITYEYVPGPFMRVLVKALKNGRTNNPKPFLLIIEEINRADMAAVFGDIFQLLDRGDDNVSEYPIEASEDMKKYLADELDVKKEICSKIRIPDNMFIWATMNSADQGVFPMDTAFKRRWEFSYRGIDDSEDSLIGKYVELGEGADRRSIEWNNLRKAINKFLSDKGINEDKQLGPYFIARKIVVPKDGNEIKSEDFIPAFKDKVLMYLFEDAARQRRSALFSGASIRYSEICKNFDKKGINVFCSDIVNEYERITDEHTDTQD